MHFGYSIIYVASVPETLAFYDKAFGLQTGFLHESELYGELKTGATTLAFAADEMATDPESAFDKAVSAGAVAVTASQEKPWGQIVGYLRDNNGCLAEICSPVGG